MGIRFLCPNGHKLHVKAFLAGRRGVCPHCEERFYIPTQSMPELRVTAVARRRLARPEAAVSPGTAPTPQELPVAAVVLEDQTRPNDDRQEPATTDPFAAAPGAAWYVRRTSGEQYGPANAELLQRWIGEGRITPDCLVWRDGWPEWRSAREVFRQVYHKSSGQVDGGEFDFDPDWLQPAGAAAEDGGAASRLNGSRSLNYRTPRSRATKIVFALVAAIVVLAPVLLYVLLRG